MADTSELDVSVNSPRATSTTSEPQISASDAAETLKGEGNAALKAGDLQTALEKYSSAISLDPTNSTYFSNRSVTYHKLGQYEAALEDAETAIELKPGWWKAHSRKISALHSLKQYEQALEWCDKVRLDVRPSVAASRGPTMVCLLLCLCSGRGHRIRQRCHEEFPQAYAQKHAPRCVFEAIAWQMAWQNDRPYVRRHHADI